MRSADAGGRAPSPPHLPPHVPARTPGAPVAAYRAPAWLPGGHAQTIYPVFLPRPASAYRRERGATPDGDFGDFDWHDTPGAAPDADEGASAVVPAVLSRT